MSKLITATTHTTYYAEIQQGVFIAAIKENKPGFAVHIQQDASLIDKARALGEFLAEFLKDNYKLKVLSNTSTEFAQNYFKERDVAIEKAIQISESFEVIFTPGTSQLKMSKKSECVIVAQAPPPVKIQKTAEQKTNYDAGSFANHPLIAIGSSTGGVEALMSIFSKLPNRIPAIVVAQHIPPDFSRTLCERFNKLFNFEVREAEDGDEIKPNRVLVAPGGKHLRVVKGTDGTLKAKVSDDAPVNRHRPSVDALFNSVADTVGANAIGIILTGMGDDGAKGLLKLKQMGAHTVAQNKETCVVFGMPRVAIELGAADIVLPLSEIPDIIIAGTTKQKAA